VKIHGVRVEPDEVSATLARHPDVQACVVVPREDKQGLIRLVAYVVASKQDGLAAPKLASYLSKTLPTPMIPTAFAFLEQLPLTTNGKIDREALPPPEVIGLNSDRHFATPRTLTEEMLARIWGEVLGLEQVGVHDSFFELGGHSLQAFKLVHRVCQSFEVEVPLRRLFETPTIAGLGEYIDGECR
jgi:acyl carrier protein